MRIVSVVFAVLFLGSAQSVCLCETVTLEDIMAGLRRDVSGNRARDYTMRLWEHDKWSTLPMWNMTVKEISEIIAALVEPDQLGGNILLVVRR